MAHERERTHPASTSPEITKELIAIVRRRAHRVAAATSQAWLVEELIGHGLVGLAWARATYRPELGVPFEKYALVCARRMLCALRQNDPVGERDAAKFRALGKRDSSSLTPADLAFMEAVRSRRCRRSFQDLMDHEQPGFASPEALVVAHEDRKAMRSLIEGLTPRLRHIIERHYFEDESLRDIARTMGVTPQRVSQLHAAALAKLRRSLGEAAA